MSRSKLRAISVSLLCTLLLACQPEPQASANETPDPPLASNSPTPTAAPKPAGELNQLDAHPPPAAAVPTNYFERARAQADRQLQQQSERCAQIEAQLQDDCITSANTQHEAALAAARVEYEEQLAEDSRAQEE